jgi:hypothetical protein
MWSQQQSQAADARLLFHKPHLMARCGAQRGDVVVTVCEAVLNTYREVA